MGAGTGGTCGKFPGGIKMKGVTGTASVDLGYGAIVGVLVVINALGDAVNPATDDLSATHSGYHLVRHVPQVGPRTWPPEAAGVSKMVEPGANTTVACVATNLHLHKTRLRKLASLATPA
ncbi:P1 family peptidase [Caldinitratiruptor microaerophilus]|uniref:Peptidase family S58 n=1 Tax=Caldinitratiruptor microaerophilus TaxID=671077 RepID=A0AA35CKJ3_9FIRM|nr:P1 family peptidase [Caldinitratiruptor microaerophilus]BDG60113.1 hypothetical protein caldi_12030 [Caldinitratiruptor microaerophilus]